MKRMKAAVYGLVVVLAFLAGGLFGSYRGYQGGVQDGNAKVQAIMDTCACWDKRLTVKYMVPWFGAGA